MNPLGLLIHITDTNLLLTQSMRVPHMFSTVVHSRKRLAITKHRPFASGNSAVISLDLSMSFVDVAVQLSFRSVSRGAGRALEWSSVALAVVTKMHQYMLPGQFPLERLAVLLVVTLVLEGFSACGPGALDARPIGRGDSNRPPGT